MWHEARKQERKIRGMLVDYRKRAERRQDFYERIKADPTQFMQIHGRKCKIHLDPAVAAAGDSPAIMMPWQGMLDNLIDRFDGRAYLEPDRIPVAAKPVAGAVETDADVSPEERLCNYERYRILAQNDFLAISEEKYLHQLHLEEQFGIQAQLEQEKSHKSKKNAANASTGVAIGYTYEDSTGDTSTGGHLGAAGGNGSTSAAAAGDAAADDESDSDLDVDVAIDIGKIDTAQAHELNTCGRHYGMRSNDFYSFLTKDADEADALKIAREEEQEKIMLSGRKSRRERRAQRERRFAGRAISPPSYATKEEPGPVDDEADVPSAESRSPSPENSGKITYITSFGGEEDVQQHAKTSSSFGGGAATTATGPQPTGVSAAAAVTYADKVRENLDKLRRLNQGSQRSPSPDTPLAYQRRARGRGSSYSRSRSPSYGDRRRTSRRGRGSSSPRIPRRPAAGRYRSRSRSPSRRRTRRPKRSASRSSGSRYSRSRSRSTHGRRSSRRRYSTSSSSSSSTSAASSGHTARRRRRLHGHSSSSAGNDRRRRTTARGRRYATSSSSSSTSSCTSPASSSSRSTRSRSARVPSPSPSKRATVTAATRPNTVVPTAGNGQQAQTPSSTVPLPPNIAGGTPQPVSPPVPSVSLPKVAAPAQNIVKLEEPVIPIRRYYGRKRDDQTSSEDDDDEESAGAGVKAESTAADMMASAGTTRGSAHSAGSPGSTAGTSNSTDEPAGVSSRNASPQPYSKFGKQPTTSTTVDTKFGGSSASSASCNPRDRLKRKMQILLNKQYKADKLAEIEKSERQVQQQQEREDEMRELALRLRRRQRELRHKYGTPTSSHADSDSDHNPHRADDQRRNGGAANAAGAEFDGESLRIKPTVHAAAAAAGRATAGGHQHQRQQQAHSSTSSAARARRSESHDSNARSRSRSPRSRSRSRSRRPAQRQRSRSRSRNGRRTTARSDDYRGGRSDQQSYGRQQQQQQQFRSRSRSREPRGEYERDGDGGGRGGGRGGYDQRSSIVRPPKRYDEPRGGGADERHRDTGSRAYRSGGRNASAETPAAAATASRQRTGNKLVDY